MSGPGLFRSLFINGASSNHPCWGLRFLGFVIVCGFRGDFQEICFGPSNIVVQTHSLANLVVSPGCCCLLLRCLRSCPWSLEKFSVGFYRAILAPKFFPIKSIVIALSHSLVTSGATACSGSGRCGTTWFSSRTSRPSQNSPRAGRTVWGSSLFLAICELSEDLS